MGKISRRLFLRNTAAAGAAAATVAAPVVVEASTSTPEDRLAFHIEGLKQAVSEIDPTINDWDITTAEVLKRPALRHLRMGFVITGSRRTSNFDGDGWYERREGSGAKSVWLAWPDMKNSTEREEWWNFTKFPAAPGSEKIRLVREDCEHFVSRRCNPYR